MAFPIDWKSQESMSNIDALPPARVVDLIANSIAANTRRAYASDLAQFEVWAEASLRRPAWSPITSLSTPTR
jgi:hypothetical protein